MAEEKSDSADWDPCANLHLQLAEIEMLESMFPNPGEFEFSDPAAVADCQQVAAGETLPYALPGLEFYVRLKLERVEKPLELLVSFPHEYPSRAPPEFYARWSPLANDKHRQLNEDLRAHAGATYERDLCVVQTTQWLQEHAPAYLSVAIRVDAAAARTRGPVAFKRLWIYSHHIYSKVKRRDMLDLASELRLTGFTLPGKPGVVCVEGCCADVDDFWSRVRNWTWKRISAKREETCAVTGYDDVDRLRKFENFEEKAFNVRKQYSREFTQDLGLFYKFLEEKDLGFVFKDFFGVDGKQS
ncbi:PREDICTED: RWD domain-containing protein 2B-like [Priapulus caudatus]|uniref:RWD domain-containing protein 2B-like n=1 Tax=Priapulus caudatus TaxID=37621 RepID=A0ABM1E5I9_PRICU|nr:PREDICTED: RWD domain-containing protein 2B-like [Priapulus caudatus]